jgi:hypothetical protein
METKIKKYNWNEAWELVKSGKKINQSEIEFSNNVPWFVVQEFNNAGLRVPKQFIDYEDDKINYNDIPPIDELLESGEFKEVFTVKFDLEISNWLHESKINYNNLINDYLRTIYQSIKKVKEESDILK